MKVTVLTRHDNVGGESYDSIARAFEVHVKQPDTKIYATAILYGNEDSPERIEFFTKKQTHYGDSAMRNWIANSTRE